jgi:uncharacterized membrane protein YozB (DUF420 family)
MVETWSVLGRADMTITMEKSADRVAKKRKWRPWMLLLAVVVLPFLVYSVPPYLSLDPARSRIPAPADVPVYYPVLVTHVIFASIAMITCCLQIWPWFRRRFPVAHRRIGRVYVFAGVLPAGLAGLTLGTVSPFGPMTRVSDVLLALLWLGCTAAGFRAARQRRFGDHRRWMIRSFALTMSIILNRVWSVLGIILLSPKLDSTFGGSEVALQQTISGLSAWLGWTTALLLAQWWLDRKAGKARPKIEFVKYGERAKVAR